jgi:bifunctional non-homologous end joining protein LigD
MLRLYQPCIPTRSTVVPSGSEWVHEIKHDGYRIIAHKMGDRVQLLTRNGYDWTDRYPCISNAMDNLMVRSTVIDGEAVVCGRDGVSDFEKLHSHAYDDQAILYAFDLLELDGEDLRPRRLEQRKAMLTAVLRRAPSGHLSGRARGRRRRGHLRCCLPSRIGGHRVEAPGYALYVGAVQDLDQDQEPEQPGNAASR